jgi:hypothetical protein
MSIYGFRSVLFKKACGGIVVKSTKEQCGVEETGNITLCGRRNASVYGRSIPLAVTAGNAAVTSM